MNAFQCFNLTSRNQSSRYLAKLINKEFRKPWFLWQITTKWVFSKSNKCWGLAVDSISSIGWPWPIGNKNSFLGGNSNNAGFEKILKRYCFENILKRYCWPIAVLVKILKSRTFWLKWAHWMEKLLLLNGYTVVCWGYDFFLPYTFCTNVEKKLW